MKKFFRKFAAATVAAAWVAALLPLTLNASDSALAASTEYNFVSCIQEKGQAHVLLMMDESGSIYGMGGSTPSDPKNVRIAGAQILLDRLQEVADRYGKTVNVQLAGFGDNFIPRPAAAWTTLTANSPTNLKTLIDTSKTWAKSSKTKNWKETDLVTAMAGARDLFAAAPAESCKLFVFFKDGADFHAFRDSKNPSPVADYTKIDDLLDAHKIDKANAAAINEICRNGGLADALRDDSNLYSIGVGISDGNNESEGFKKFKAVIEGVSTPGCQGGSAPAHGKYVRAEDLAGLPGLFSDLLDPSHRAPTKRGNFTLDLKHALVGVRVLSAGVTSKSFTLVPPKACSLPAQTFKATEGNKTDLNLGQGVTGNVSWLGDDANLETVSLVMKHTALNDDSCWVGRWEFKPGAEAISNLYFDTDLQASAAFDLKTAPYVVPGDTKGALYTVKVSRPSDSTASKLSEEAIGKDVSLTVNGFVRNAETKEIESSFTEFTVAGDQFDEDRYLVAAGDQPFGKYELVLTLSIAIDGFSEELMPVTTQSTFDVRSAKPTPTIGKVTNFGVLNGTERSHGTLTIIGSPEEDFTVDLSKAESGIAASSFPEGIKYVFAFAKGEKQTFTVPKGQTITVDVWIKAAPIDEKGDGEVHYKMPVGGKLSVAVSPVSEPNTVVAISGKFAAEQRASTSTLWTLVLMGVFLALAVLINLIIIRIISGLLSRTPKSDVWVQYKFAQVEFNDQGLVNFQALRSQIDNQQTYDNAIINKDRKSVNLGERSAKVVGNKFSLSELGHLEISNTAGQIGLSSNNENAPQLPLALNSSWAFYLNPQTLAVAKAGNVCNATLLVVRLGNEQKPVTEVLDDFEAKASEFLTKQLERIKVAPSASFEDSTGWGTPASGFASEVGSAPQPKPANQNPPAPTQQNNDFNSDQW